MSTPTQQQECVALAKYAVQGAIDRLHAIFPRIPKELRADIVVLFTDLDYVKGAVVDLEEGLK